MPTDCSADRFEFAPVEGRAVVAGFDGGAITSDAGALLLGATDRAIGLVRRFAGLLRAISRAPDQVEHELATLVGQRVFALALGYEDLVDHDDLRHDPVLAAARRQARRAPRRLRAAGRQVDAQPARACAGRASRRATTRSAMTRRAIERLFVELFLDAHSTPPEADRARPRRHRRPAARRTRRAASSTATMTATATCRSTSSAATTCWRPSCGGRTSTPAPARSRRSARHRRPDPRALAAGADRAAGRQRLRPRGADGLVRGATGRLRLRPGPQRRAWSARSRPSSPWPRGRRPSGPASRRAASRTSAIRPWTAGAARAGWSARPSSWSTAPASRAPTRASSSPRSAAEAWPPRGLYEQLYCARGEMENRIKECQLDLFADRTSAATMRANQLRLWFASMAYVLLCGACAGSACRHTRLARGHLRHDPPQAAQDRRAGARLGPPGHGRHGLRPPLAARLGHRPPSPHRGGRLTTTQTAHSRHHPTRRCPRAATRDHARHQSGRRGASG